jgi:hypothetical protein
VAWRASSTRCLLLLHLDLGRGADLDDGHAADQLGQALLQLLAVVVGGGLLDLGADLLDPALDVLGFLPAPSTMVVLSLSMVTLAWRVPRSLSVTFSSLRPRSSLMTLPPVRMAMSLQHGLAAVAEARSLDGRDLQGAAELVDDQGRQRLALDVLGDDQQRLALLGDLLEHRQQVLHVGDLLLVDQDVGVLQLGPPCARGRSRSRARGSRGRTACPRRRRARSPALGSPRR